MSHRYDNTNVPGPDAQAKEEHTQPFHSEVYTRPSQEHVIGIDLPFLKFGIDPREGTFKAGVDLGLGYAEGKIGAQFGGKAGVDLGPLARAHVAGQAGVGPEGFNVDGATRTRVLVGEANTRLHAGLGEKTGVGYGVDTAVGPVGARHEAHAFLTPDGLGAGAGARAGIDGVAGARLHGRLAVNDYDSEVRAGGGVRFGKAALGAGAGIMTDGNATIRPDVYIDGAAGPNRGRLDLNPPICAYYNPNNALYYGEGRAPQAVARAYSDAVQRAELPPPQPQVTEVRPHQSVPYEAATPENIARYDKYAHQHIRNESAHLVQPGESFADIISQLRPDATREGLSSEAGHLAHINHYRSAVSQPKEGTKIATLSKDEVDWEAKKMVAKHFGWPAPQS